jgi:hypothetical protein
MIGAQTSCPRPLDGDNPPPQASSPRCSLWVIHVALRSRCFHADNVSFPSVCDRCKSFRLNKRLPLTLALSPCTCRARGEGTQAAPSRPNLARNRQAGSDHEPTRPRGKQKICKCIPRFLHGISRAGRKRGICLLKVAAPLRRRPGSAHTPQALRCKIRARIVPSRPRMRVSISAASETAPSASSTT